MDTVGNWLCPQDPRQPHPMALLGSAHMDALLVWSCWLLPMVLWGWHCMLSVVLLFWHLSSGNCYFYGPTTYSFPYGGVTLPCGRSLSGSLGFEHLLKSRCRLFEFYMSIWLPPKKKKSPPYAHGCCQVCVLKIDRISNTWGHLKYSWISPTLHRVQSCSGELYPRPFPSNHSVFLEVWEGQP
jgi:hypothetical protein